MWIQEERAFQAKSTSHWEAALPENQSGGPAGERSTRQRARFSLSRPWGPCTLHRALDLGRSGLRALLKEEVGVGGTEKNSGDRPWGRELARSLQGGRSCGESRMNFVLVVLRL